MSSRSLKHWPTPGFHLDESNFGNGPDWLVPEFWNTRTPNNSCPFYPFLERFAACYRT